MRAAQGFRGLTSGLVSAVCGMRSGRVGRDGWSVGTDEETSRVSEEGRRKTRTRKNSVALHGTPRVFSRGKQALYSKLANGE